MRVGDLVVWRRRRYRVRGIDPMSVTGRTAELEELATGRTSRVPIAEIRPAAGEAATPSDRPA